MDDQLREIGRGGPIDVHLQEAYFTTHVIARRLTGGAQECEAKNQMIPNLNVNDLLDYTEWERQKWHGWLQQHGEGVLAINAGPHGDSRFESVGDLVRHIFSAEKRYVQRLAGRPLTDTASIPNDDLEALFRFGQQSRQELKELLDTLPAEEWDAPRNFKILTYLLSATPKKIVMHILMHEIRHWAQIATLLRLNGLTGEFHDFLFSPVLGGEFTREQDQAQTRESAAR
jgi:uncharacterized damage-inducible protein DinB